MDERIRKSLRSIALLKGIIREGLDPDPRGSAGPVIIRAAQAEVYLHKLYHYAVVIFGKKEWSDSQYEIASAWYRSRQVLKEFINYYDQWYPPGTYKDREATEYLDKLWEQAQQEDSCQTFPSTPSST